MLNFFSILSFLFYCSCGTHAGSNMNTNDSIRCIIVSQVFPLLDEDGKFTIYDTPSIAIYYYRELTAYKFAIRSDTLENGKLVNSAYHNRFFVYKKGNSFGYVYDSTVKPGTKVLTDSMFKNILWCEANNLYAGFSDNNIVLLSSYRNKDSGTLHEFYTYKRRSDSTMRGNFSLSFSDKIKGIDCSLSKELDSIKNMKLYNVRMEGYIQYPKEGKIISVTLRSVNTLRETAITNHAEVLSYFKRYIKDNGD